MKTSAVSYDSELNDWSPVRKESPGKRSKEGILSLRDGQTCENSDIHDIGELQVVYENGRLLRDCDFSELRENLKNSRN